MDIHVSMTFGSVEEMVRVLGGGGANALAAPAPVQETPTPAEEPAPSSDGGGTPAPMASAVELAQELAVDIESVTGTGKDGRITKKDVQTRADELKAQADAEKAKRDAGGTEDPAAGGTEDPPPVEGPSVNALREIFAKVQEECGLPACLEVLKGFDIQRLRELPDDKRDAFMEACQAKIAAS